MLFGLVIVLVVLLIGLMYFIKTKQKQNAATQRVAKPLVHELVLTIKKDSIEPKVLSVKRQSVIIVRNSDTIAHKISSDYPRFKSPTIGANSEYSFAVITPGNWLFYFTTDKNVNTVIQVNSQ